MTKSIIRQAAIFLFILTVIAFSFQESRAQAIGYLEVVGSVSQLGKNLEGATITVMRGNEKIDQVTTNNGGRFIVNLELNSSYVIIYNKNGSFSKSVEFDTKVPDDLQSQIFSLKHIKISIFKE